MDGKQTGKKFPGFSTHAQISATFGLVFAFILFYFSATGEKSALLSMPGPVFRYMLPVVMVYLGVMAVYNLRYFKETGSERLWVLVRPLSLVFSFFLFFEMLPGDWLRYPFLFFSVLAITFSEYSLGKFSENIVTNETLLGAFAFFTGLSGIRFYFPGFGWLCTMLGFLGSFVFARSFFEFLPHDKKVKILVAFLLSFLQAQVFWFSGFLPFHFSVIGFLCFLVFYFGLMTNFNNFYKTLATKKIVFYLGLVFTCAFLVLLATAWQSQVKQ